MAEETRNAARPGVVLAVVCSGVILSSLDLFIVNVALPQISRGFHGASLSDLSWVLNAYAVVFAALLVPAGRLADRAGRRGGFLIGVAIFTASSAACALANSVGPARRVPHHPGCGRGTTDPDLAGTASSPPIRPSVARARFAIWTASRRARRGRRAGARRRARRRRAGAGCSSSTFRSGSPRSSPAAGLAAPAARRARAASRSPRCGAADRRDRLPYPRPRQGARLGLGLGTDLGALAGATVCLVVFVLRSARHRSPVIELSLLRERGMPSRCWPQLSSRPRSGQCSYRSSFGCRTTGTGRRSGPGWPCSQGL